MKTKLLFISTLLSLIPIFASAHDIEVKNADGKTIYYNYSKDGKELYVTCRGTSASDYKDEYTGTISIPEEVTYEDKTLIVTKIGAGAFHWCTNLTSVTIPNTIKSIEQSAFTRCVITSINIPCSVTNIGVSAFSDCNLLTSISIPNSVTTIGNSAFADCSNLTSVNLPNNLTRINDNTFQYCRALTSIIIPNSVNYIGEYAFHGCKNISSVTIGNSVTSIGNSAFYDCRNLTSITIPKSVTSIGSCAFKNSDITKIVSNIENPFSIGVEVFSENTRENATLHVPAGTIEKYKSTEGWKYFANIEEGDGGGITPTPVVGQCATPTISYNNGKLVFNCETEGAICYYTISIPDFKSGSGNEVQLSVKYNISVYATKNGYNNSEPATATLCWIDVEPESEGLVDEVTNVKASPVMIQNNGGMLTVHGVHDGTEVEVYSLSGVSEGSAISQSGQAIVNTNLQPGSFAIVKIGTKSIKLLMK